MAIIIRGRRNKRPRTYPTVLKFEAAILFVVAMELVAYLIHIGVLPQETQLE